MLCLSLPRRLIGVEMPVLSVFLFLLAGVATAQQTRPALPQVIVQSASLASLTTTVEALGNLRANESITLTSNETKKITRINFDDGQRVTQGQVLVEMTSREESALLEEARFNRDEARKQLDRVRELVRRGAASQAELDLRTREYEAAGARYNATESRLKDLVLIAPFSGVVGLRQMSVGALVSPGQPITTLNDDSKMKLDFTVPAVYLRHLKVGVPVVAKSRDLGDKTFQGHLVSIDNQIDEVTRSIKVRALLDNPQHELTQGMLMLVEVQAASREALVISEAALVPLAGDHFVFVVQEEAGALAVERRQITIGERFPGAVEVLEGLSAGEKVVTHGLQKIRAGQKVQIRAEEKPFSAAGESLPLSDLLSSPTP